MDKLNAILGELTLGPISIFSALSMLGILALITLSYRDIDFRWGVYLAGAIALIRLPLVWYKRQLLGDHDVTSFVATMTVATFIGMIAIWTFLRWLHQGRTRA
ncbi:hypothetical protein B0E45_22555 [Sinorhizobium sp. A49]|uniref:hypothetical protein n=1 Tax=Sinorhizobium sp. A49 TaxID=1945861 RepID=UPI000986A9C1|nr:hypothetical protein [Sinorhizobium sp. A49]OOG67443.1 hypothetical protein B0E45_22555 [Sinorhizobium sp. A49]